MANSAQNGQQSHPLAERLRAFPSLSQKAKTVFATRGAVRRLAPNELWASRTEPARGIALILQGALRSVATTSEGKEFVFSIMRQGDVWGVVSAIDGLKSANDIYAHGETTLLTLDRRLVQELMEQEHEFRDWLVMLLCRRFRSAITIMEDRALQPLVVRLARLLMSLGNTPGASRDTAHVTQEMLAKILSCSRPTVTKALRSFEERKLISLSYGRIEILDDAALAELLGGGERNLYM